MIENPQENYPELELKTNLKRVITQKTGPDTLNKALNSPIDTNNLNSVLKNVEDDKVFNYLNVQRTQTEVLNQISKEITPNEEEKIDKNKLCVNTNIKKEAQKNLDIYYTRPRFDRFNQPITRKGKQKVTFIDKVSNCNLTQNIDIESFKEFNKVENNKTSSYQQNTCCVII